MCVCVDYHNTVSAYSRSLHQARQVKLLDGYKIFLTRNVTPDRASLSDIVKCSGGQLLDTLPTVKDDKTLVVSTEQDLSSCSAALEAGVVVYTPELILSGALRQELDINAYPSMCVCVCVRTT